MPDDQAALVALYPTLVALPVVSWGELAICAAWLVLGAVLTWVLAVRPSRRSAVRYDLPLFRVRDLHVFLAGGTPIHVALGQQNRPQARAVRYKRVRSGGAEKVKLSAKCSSTKRRSPLANAL